MSFKNPYRPGAGHMPPYLAGRNHETSEFKKLLGQETILENLILTGLRGVGKTVLLESFKPLAIENGWKWVGNDISESATLTESNLAIRILTDLSVVTSTLEISKVVDKRMGFQPESHISSIYLDFHTLSNVYNSVPGLVSDKLKYILELVWSLFANQHSRGLIFAYDEAQNLSDHSSKSEFPLSLILDVFQSIQKKGIPFMVILTGLPTLFPRCVEARTYSERMFHVMFLDKLNLQESKDAIEKPINDEDCPVTFKAESIDKIVEISGGYPYFIQYICREVYDLFIQQFDSGESAPSVPVDSIYAKLDSDFFAGRWAKATDRQRELLRVIASLDGCDNEFSVQEVTQKSKVFLERGFSNSHVNQMLNSLSNSGLIFKNRYGRYAFAVPLLGQFIRRQFKDNLE